MLANIAYLDSRIVDLGNRKKKAKLGIIQALLLSIPFESLLLSVVHNWRPCGHSRLNGGRGSSWSTRAKSANALLCWVGFFPGWDSGRIFHLALIQISGISHSAKPEENGARNHRYDDSNE